MKRKNNFNLENICLILNARRQKRCRAEKALLGPPPTFIFWASPKGKCCKAFGLNWRGMLIRYILMSHYPKAINSKLVILKNSIFVQICRSTPPPPKKTPTVSIVQNCPSAPQIRPQNWVIHGLFFISVSSIIVKFSKDWIRTADLWCGKRPLYQLIHNHCPIKCFTLSFPFKPKPGPWSSLVEGDESCIGPSGKLLGLWQI